jgi:hypothetical protein
MNNTLSILDLAYEERQFVVVGSDRRKVKRARKRGLVVLQVLPKSATELTFPLGHPRSGIVYVAHPLIASEYIPMANFHKEIFEGRVREAVDLLECLGATSLDVEQISSLHSFRALGAGLAIPGLAEIGTTGERDSASASNIRYSGSYHPADDPHVPERLIWYPHERFWQDLVRQRLTRGLNDFELRVEHAENFGVTARISVFASQVGLDIGGEFTDYTSLVWRMRGSFAPWSPSVPEQPSPRVTKASLNLVDTSWVFGGERKTKVRFLAGDLVVFDHIGSHSNADDDWSAEGRWALQGDQLRFDCNGFTLYEVAVSEDQMIGTWQRMQGDDRSSSPTSLRRLDG